jgi:hypothetical protein
MVAGGLLSDSFAVLTLACYILVCLHAIIGLLSVDGSRPEPPDRASQTAEPQLGPASRLRLVQAGRVRVAAPARPGQITPANGRKKPDLLLPKKLPAERAFGRSAPALLDAATLPAFQATAHITDPAKPSMRRPASETSLGVIELSAKQTGRNKAKTPPEREIAIHAVGRPTVLDRMMENTREAPKTPGAPQPTPPTLIRFRSKGSDSKGACGITNPTKLSMRRPASETSLGVIELSAKQTGRNKAKTPPEREIAIHAVGRPTVLDRMMENTREAPKTPGAPQPTPPTLIRFRSKGSDSKGACGITNPTKLNMRRPASETSLGVIELSAKQTGSNKAKTPPEREIAIHAVGRPTVLDRMMENTREAPKTPGVPPTPPTLIRFRSKGSDSAGACGITNPAKLSMRRPASETSLGGIELSAKQTGSNKAKTPPEREITMHGGALARRLAFKMQRVEERLALACRAESMQRGVAVDASVPAKKASGWHSEPSMQTSSESSLGVNELSPNSAFRHPASPIPQGTGSKDSRRGSSLGIKSSRGPSVSSSARFYANVVTRRVGMQSGNAL